MKVDKSAYVSPRTIVYTVPRHHIIITSGTKNLTVIDDYGDGEDMWDWDDEE